jgi:hypothetical protein
MMWSCWQAGVQAGGAVVVMVLGCFLLSNTEIFSQQREKKRLFRNTKTNL